MPTLPTLTSLTFTVAFKIKKMFISFLSWVLKVSYTPNSNRRKLIVRRPLHS
jgi:hypothetical protein